MSNVVVTGETAHQSCEIRTYRGVYIRGRVVDDESGAPIRGITVEAEDYTFETTTSNDGTFALGPVGPGTFKISAGEGKWLTASTHETAGDSDVLLRLEVGGGVYGTVRDAETGDLVDAQVRITPVSRRGWTQTSARAGRFRIEGADEGDYNLTAQTPDGRYGTRTNVELTRDKNVDLEVEVYPGGKLLCRYEGDGSPTFDVLQDDVVVAWGVSTRNEPPGSSFRRGSSSSTFAFGDRCVRRDPS